jgi:hypothetical protein
MKMNFLTGIDKRVQNQLKKKKKEGEGGTTQYNTSSMILTFICTSTTGSATKLEALEYQLGSSSYPKGKYNKNQLPKFLHDITKTCP